MDSHIFNIAAGNRQGGSKAKGDAKRLKGQKKRKHKKPKKHGEERIAQIELQQKQLANAVDHERERMTRQNSMSTQVTQLRENNASYAGVMAKDDNFQQVYKSFYETFNDELRTNHSALVAAKQMRDDKNDALKLAIERLKAQTKTGLADTENIIQACYFKTQSMRKAFPALHHQWVEDAKKNEKGGAKPDMPDMPGEMPTPAATSEEETEKTGENSRFGSLPAYLRPLKAI